MGLLVLLLLLAAVALMGLLAVWRHPGPVPYFAGLALALMPALLMTAVIQSTLGVPLTQGRRGADVPWRVTLAALRLPLPEEGLSIGGDAQSDDLVVPGLPPDAAVHVIASHVAASHGTPDLSLTLKDDEPGARGGIFTAREAPGDGDSLGGTLIPPGAEVCVSDDGKVCRADSQRLRWRPSGDTALLSSGTGQAAAQGCPLPPPGVGRSASSLAKRVFPLATYARPGCADRARFAWDEGEPAEELLYWSERAPTWLDHLLFWRRTPLALHLLPVDYGRVLLVVSPGHTTRIARAPLTLHPGDETRLSVYQIIPAAALPTADRGDDNFARLQERRSFQVRYGSPAGVPTLDVFLDTPQTVSLTAGAHPALGISAQSAGPGSLAGGAQIAGFSLLGKPAAAGLLTTIRPAAQVTGAPEKCRSQEGALVVQGVTGISCGRIGRWFTLGDPARVLAKVRIAPLTVPVIWISAIWALCLLNAVVRDLLQVSRPARVVLGLLELFLVLRVLVAFEASAVDARREDAVAGAWLSLVWLPLAFELVPASIAPAGLALAARLAKGGLAVLATFLIVGAAGMQTGSLAAWGAWLQGEMGKSALVSVALCVPAWWLLHGTHHLRALARWALARLARLRAGAAAALPAWRRGPLGRAALLLIAISVLHLALVLAGIKEQVAGVRIAAGLIPLLALAWAVWFARVRALRGDLSLRAELASIFLPFLGYLPFVLAHDIGAFIYFVALAVWLSAGAWPRLARERILWIAGCAAAASLLLLALAALGGAFRPLAIAGALGLVVSGLTGAVLVPWREPARLRPFLASLPVLAVIGVLAALQAGGHLLTRDAQGQGTAAKPTWQEVQGIQGLSGNSIRLLDLLAPRAVENLGVRAAYEQRVAMAEMLEFGSTLAGRGWLRIPQPDALRQTHVDDNVTAVHLLGPFGRAGGLGVGVLLLGFAACIYRLSASRPPSLRNRAQLGATLLAGTSLYMLLANIAQVPFTGRNFYFLAVSSHSDLLEGGMLLVIVLSAFTRRRQERAGA